MIDNKNQTNLGQSETLYLNIEVINHDINGIFKFINVFIYVINPCCSDKLGENKINMSLVQPLTTHRHILL